MDSLAGRFIEADYLGRKASTFTHAADLGQSPGHYTPEMVLWLFEHGVMSLYTPLVQNQMTFSEAIR